MNNNEQQKGKYSYNINNLLISWYNASKIEPDRKEVRKTLQHLWLLKKQK
jgi:hypothetical protein